MRRLGGGEGAFPSHSLVRGDTAGAFFRRWICVQIRFGGWVGWFWSLLGEVGSMDSIKISFKTGDVQRILYCKRIVGECTTGIEEIWGGSSVVST